MTPQPNPSPGNNIPIFFVRDAISFPDLIHSLRQNPQSNLQEWWRVLDFLSFHPESLHIQTWLMDDYGLPYSYRHTNGCVLSLSPTLFSEDSVSRYKILASTKLLR